ncbi:MAG: DUF305 domain-containing protein [Chloroflexia bacterium]|nr:DUF305 domain-containing protein [Chloroflexia bacterium]
MNQLRWVAMALVALVLMACGNTSAGAPTATAGHAMAGHDMTAMSMTNDAPYDALFIDSMIVHHQGAIAMAQEALAKAAHAELKQFAKNVITVQDGEITQMQVWRQDWYPKVAISAGTGMDMGDMIVAQDDRFSYDVRWINSMISHHQAAITMAKEALTKAEHPEIKNLAQAIIDTQSAELTQLETWRDQWR